MSATDTTRWNRADRLGATVVSAAEAESLQRRGTLHLFIARGCFIASGYAVMVLLARGLGTVNYGIYGVVISQLLWLEILMNAGVPGAAAKLLADGRHDASDVERSARAFLAGLSVLLVAAFWMMAPRVASLMGIPGGPVLYRIAIIDLPFAAVYASYEGVLYGRREFGTLAVIQVVYALARVAGVTALLGLGLSVERVLIAYVVSTCITCAVLMGRFRLPGLRPKRTTIRTIVAIAAPLALYLVSSQVLVNLDLWALKALWMGGGEVVGQYVASTNLARTLALIPSAQAGVVFASVAWAVATHDTAGAQRHIHAATRVVVIVAVAAGLILGLNASDTMSVLFSSAYAPGQPFLRLQLVGFALYALLDSFAQTLMAAGHMWLVAGGLTAMVPLVWLSNYLLIARFGPLGAATSLVIGMGVCAALAGSMTYRHFGSVVRFAVLGRVGVAAGVVALASALIRVHGPLVIVKVLLLGGLYLFVLGALGEVTAKDFGHPWSRQSA